jgi:hypothetical protein
VNLGLTSIESIAIEKLLQGLGSSVQENLTHFLPSLLSGWIALVNNRGMFHQVKRSMGNRKRCPSSIKSSSSACQTNSLERPNSLRNSRAGRDFEQS